MTRTRRAFLASVGAVSAVGTLGTTAAGAADAPTVLMHSGGGNYFFDPVGLFVEPGTTVTFKIATGVHTATAYEKRIPKGAPAWDSGIVTGQGSTWEHTFETRGTHDYYCVPHRSFGMVGRLVVGEPGGPATKSKIPNGDVPGSDAIVEQGAISNEEFTTGGGGAGEGSSGSGSWLLGGGLLGGMAALAIAVYWVVNSEGEPYRVGSEEWRERERSK